MTTKRRIREPLEVNINGVSYRGERVIEGTHKLNQYIVYKDRCIPDLKDYLPDEKDKSMLSFSRLIFSELASGRTLSTHPCSKYGL